MHDRASVLGAIRTAIEPLDCVHAAWEGGAVAFDRADPWSDIDLCVDADDGRAGEVFSAIESALETLGGVSLKYPVPWPPEHDYAQAFYRLREASPFLILDLAIFRHSASDKMLAPEIHGAARFLFSKKDGPAVRPLDRGAHADRLLARMERLRGRVAIFGNFIEKEFHRRHPIEAIWNYQKVVLEPLVEALRALHHPAHFDFAHRYIHDELPREVAARLQALFFVADEADLRRKSEAAERWLRETLDSIDRETVLRKLGEDSRSRSA